MILQGQTTCDHRIGDPIQVYESVNCPRCRGVGIYGGVSYDSSGRLKILSNEAALSQQIRKIITENMRSSGYGFNYSIFKNGLNDDSVMLTKVEVLRCMNYLKALQQANKKNGFRYMSREELDRIENIQVSRQPIEPRKLFIKFDAITTKGSKVPIQQFMGR